MSKNNVLDTQSAQHESINVNNGKDWTLRTHERPFGHVCFNYIVDTIIGATAWDSVERTQSNSTERLTFKNSGTAVKIIEIAYNGLNWTITEGTIGDNFLLLENDDFILLENGDKIILEA